MPSGGRSFTGPSAALHLAEAGSAVAVLEAREIGWGASGRAFGQVVPYMKHDRQSILDRYGPERGARVVDAVSAGPAEVFALIDRHGIDCDLVRTGLIFGAHTPSGGKALAARAAYWQGRGEPVELPEGAAAAGAVGSAAYPAALLDRRGGHLNPYAYAHGLAAAAARLGASIHAGTPVHGIRRDGGRWRLDAGAAEITADAVILAANAYGGDLWPGLRQSVIPMRGHGVVSVPLSDNQLGGVLPGGQPLTDTRRLFSGIRVLPGGRLHVSLDGPAFTAAGGPYLEKAQARVARLFPDLGRLEWEEAWSGWIALTPDQFPRVHELAPGLYSGLGYSGRGIAAATMIGRELAARATGAPDDALVFPLDPLRPLPLHGLAALPIGALLNWWRVLDGMDERRFGRG